MTDAPVTREQVEALASRLQSFAQGCRGSMWQSRNETINLCDEAAVALLAALDDLDAVKAERDMQRGFAEQNGRAALAWQADAEFATTALAALTARNEALEREREVIDYVLQEPIHNRLVPRVVDIAYSAFMNAKRPNREDGGPTDWVTDTYPMVMAKIGEIRRAALQQKDTPDAK